MTDPDGWTRLSTDEFTLLWTACDFGPPPVILSLPQRARTWEDREQLIGSALTALAERGLATEWQAAPEVLAPLRAVHEADLTLSLFADWQGERRRAVLGSGRGGAAIVVVSGEDAYLRPVRPTGLVTALLENLDPLPAGPGHAANVRKPDFERACVAGERNGTEAFLDALQDAGIRTPEARTVLRAVIGRMADGEVEIGRRHRDRSPMPPVDGVRWLDTEEGRYAVRQRGEWISIIPADVPKLAALLEESLED